MDKDAREKIRAMTKSLQECLTVLESGELVNVMQIAQVHGFPYTGPKVNIPALKAAITNGEALAG